MTLWYLALAIDIFAALLRLPAKIDWQSTIINGISDNLHCLLGSLTVVCATVRVVNCGLFLALKCNTDNCQL